MVTNQCIKHIFIIDQSLALNAEFVQSVREHLNIEPIELFSSDKYDYTLPDVLYISSTFEGEFFERLIHDKKIVVSDLIIQECIDKKEGLTFKHSLFNRHMNDFLVCFSIANKRNILSSGKLNHYLNLIRFMGGKSRKDMKSGRSFERTHLIESTTDSDNYRMARVYELPILEKEWIDHLWANRRNVNFDSNDASDLMRFRIKPFLNLFITLHNFTEDQITNFTLKVEENDGKIVSWDDPRATHLIIRDGSNFKYVEDVAKMKYIPKFIVTEKWLQTCLDTKYREIEEKWELPIPETLRQDELSISMNRTDSSFNGRYSCILSKSAFDQSIEDSFAISTSTDPNDQKKYAITQELFQTELNYVTILKDILKIFYQPLVTHQQPDEFPNEIELKTIFGYLKPIISVHEKVIMELEPVVKNWSAENEVGSIFRKHSNDFLSAYPQYINFYEKTKEMITKCLEKYPKFATFVKASEALPECKKQRFHELLINPIQRLPRIELYLRELLKKTDENHPDYKPLNEALNTIVSVNSEINLEKKKTEGQIEMFDLLNEIEDCPATLLSANRHFIAKCDVKIFIFTEGDIDKFENVYTLLLFSDCLLLCKKRTVVRSHSLKERTSAFTNSMLRKPKKMYKFIETIEFTSLVRICADIVSTDFELEDSMFTLMSEASTRSFTYYPLIMKDPETTKGEFLQLIRRSYSEYFINNPHMFDRRVDELFQSVDFRSIDYEHCHEILKLSSNSKFDFIRKTKKRLNRTLSNKSRQSMRSSISMENIGDMDSIRRQRTGLLTTPRKLFEVTTKQKKY